MRIVLIGQPNCGKSTLFNQVAGYRAETGNFTGTTVTYTESKVRVGGEVLTLVDLPGTYTLTGTNPAERESLRYLLTRSVDAVINILDATHLEQGLSLTLELLEMNLPLLIAVNMMDEASRLGLEIDLASLERRLGVMALPLTASKGRGVRAVFTGVLECARSRQIPPRPLYAPEVEAAVARLAGGQSAGLNGISTAALAIKLLEQNEIVSARMEEAVSISAQPGGWSGNGNGRQPAGWQLAVDELTASLGELPRRRISRERRRLAQELAAQITRAGERRWSLIDRLDDVLLHPFWGYVTLLGVLLFIFQAVYGIGSLLEPPLLRIFDALNQPLQLAAQGSGLNPFFSRLLSGILQGIAGGVAIVLPYLLPFLFGLGLLEDIGYLPRVAFLMDALMHRIGLHGKAIVPFILGYGCNVPAVMSTRMMEDSRDRFLAATLATLVPCAARLAVVFGLVAFYLGPWLALAIYLFNLLVIALTGRILSSLLPEDTPGLILEMPSYRVPAISSVYKKAWFRVREFVVEAWPMLILGSATLALLTYFGLDRIFNWLVWPVTAALGLPFEVGTPLIFGILRKELSLIMLRQALNVEDFSQALTAAQMVIFSVFVVFYVPCLATLAVLKRELGFKNMLVITGITVVIALAAGLLARAAMLLF